jgi:hypothetical protein
MVNLPELTVSPAKVSLNETITVRSVTANFPQRAYTLSDESGKIIRKGAVNDHIAEFKLCMVGLATGVYNFSMGKVQEKIIITG